MGTKIFYCHAHWINPFLLFLENVILFFLCNNRHDWRINEISDIPGVVRMKIKNVVGTLNIHMTKHQYIYIVLSSCSFHNFINLKKWYKDILRSYRICYLLTTIILLFICNQLWELFSRTSCMKNTALAELFQGYLFFTSFTLYFFHKRKKV